MSTALLMRGVSVVMVADTDGVLPAVTMLDMNISQFLKSLGLEHLRDIFEREQVSASSWTYCVCVCVLERDPNAPFCRSRWTFWLTWVMRS